MNGIDSNPPYENFKPVVDDLTGKSTASADVELPDGKIVQVTLNYEKGATVQKMENDLKSSVNKIIALSIAYELGDKTKSLTLSGTQLKKEYTPDGLQKRNLKRAAGGKAPAKSIEISSKDMTETIIGEKLKKLTPPENAKVKSFIQNYSSNKAKPPIPPKPARQQDSPVKWAGKIKGNEVYSAATLNDNIDKIFDAAASFVKDGPCPNKVGPQERANHAKELVRELIVYLEEDGDPEGELTEKFKMAYLLGSEAKPDRLHKDHLGGYNPIMFELEGTKIFLEIKTQKPGCPQKYKDLQQRILQAYAIEEIKKT